jgi:hypothetical protein
VGKKQIAVFGAICGVALLLYPGCGSSKNGFGPGSSGGDDPQFGDHDGGGGDGGDGIFNDGSIGGGGCTNSPGGPGPVVRKCTAAAANECDGQHELPGFPPNGTHGNGFDDDCDGLVDEGCSCPGAGVTKDCWLVPASQTANGQPVGWCKENAKGSLDCKGGEFPLWSGQCRGAQPPYADDACTPGDFDCDGKDQNAKSKDCSCVPGKVVCPTTPIVTSPYPPPTNLPVKIDGKAWFDPPATASQATNWRWTLRGGDCDNILPHPTFALFPIQDGTATPIGVQANNLGVSNKEHGIFWSGANPIVYPAFSLSGDYVLTGEFDAFGEHHSCTQKIQVRAPGIRAEACWDTEPQLADLDLHMARVDGFSCGTQGWSGTCADQDCFYKSCAGFNAVNWKYPPSAASACVGWGSETNQPACANPRLDRDANGISGICAPGITNPSAIGFGFIFCGPENINVDQPSDGSTYAVSLKYFGGDIATSAHVNIYCNGERVLASGYDPVTGNAFPKLTQGGSDPDPNVNGDLWKVALVQAHVSGGTLRCDVTPTHSKSPRAQNDGSTSYCVDNSSKDGASSITRFTAGGGAPANGDALCFH